VRLVLLGCAIFGWIVVAVLALHESGSPEVWGRWSGEFAGLLAVVVGAVSVWTTGVLLHLRHPAAVSSFVRSMRARGSVVPLTVATASGLVCCGVAEGVVRAVDLMGSSLYGEIETYWWDTLEDPDLMYRHRQNFESTYQGVSVVFNEMGLRDRPTGSKQVGRKRVLMLGDSVLFGWGVEVEDTFPHQLESALRARTGASVETINAGVCSYNTEIQLAFLRRHGEALDPDVVLLLYVENDTDPTLMPPRNQGTLQSFRDEPVESLRYLLRRSRIYSIADHIIPAVLLPATPDPSAPGWRASMAALAEIAAWCEARGIVFRALLYRMTPNLKSDLLLGDIERVSTRAGFAFADTLPWFEGRDLRQLTNSLIDSHPNPAGHAVLAAETADWLADGFPPRCVTSSDLPE